MHKHSKKVLELDVVLKKEISSIPKEINFIKWRESLHPHAEAWWWRLETTPKLHSWDRLDWLWKGLTISGWTINLGLLVYICNKFLTAPGLGEVTGVIFASLLTLLKARGEFIQSGKEGFDKLLKTLHLSEHLREEAKLISTLLFSGLLLSVGFNFSFFSDLYNEGGLKNYVKNQFSGAERNFLQAIALDSDNEKAHYNLGNLYEDLQEFDKARSHYLLATKGDIDNLARNSALNNLARLYIVNGKYSLAPPLLVRALKSIQSIEDEKLESIEDKRNKIQLKYNLLKNLGWARVQQKREREAKDLLESAISFYRSLSLKEQQYITKKGSAHCLLAITLEQDRDDKDRQLEALKHWKICCKLSSVSTPEEDKWLNLAHKSLEKEGEKCKKPTFLEGSK